MANEEAAALVVRLEATQARFERDMRRAEQAASRSAGGIERRVNQMADRSEKSFQRVGRGFNRGFGPALQQAGFQIGDFATQIASGQSAMVAFTQQGTQLVSGFGPWGAAIGAAGAIVGALAVNLLSAGDEAKTFEERLDDLADTAKNLDALRDQIEDLGTLKAKYGEAAQAVIALINEERRLERERLASEARALRRDIIDSTGARGGDVAATLGVSQPGSTNLFRMQELMEALQQFNLAGTFEEAAVAARRVVNAVEEIKTVEELNPIADEIVGKLRQFERSMYDSAAVAGELEGTTGEVGENTGSAADEADRLDRNLGGAVIRASALAGTLVKAQAALAGMAASAQERLARAQISLQFSGDPEGEARALAERQAGQEIADAQRAMAGDIPSGMMPAVLDPMKENARETVSALTEAVRLEQQMIELARSASSGGGGGGGGGVARADSGPDLAEVVSRETDSIREKIAALQEERELLMARSAAMAAGVPPEEIARQQEILSASFERQRMVQELLNKASAEGLELTPQQRAEIEKLAAATENLTIANFDLQASMDAQARAAEDAKQRQENLKRSIEDVGNRFASAIQQADSFSEALRNIGIEILNLVAQGLGGAGPLGDFLGNVIPSIAAGIGGSFGGSTVGIAGGGGFGGVHSGVYAEGGYTGPGGKNEVAGIVHKGEVVWSQADVQRAGGPGAVEAMRKGRMAGFADGGLVGMSPPPVLGAPRVPQGGRSTPSVTIGDTNINITDKPGFTQEQLQRTLAEHRQKTIGDVQRLWMQNPGAFPQS